MEEYEVSLKDYIDVVRKEKAVIISIFLVAVLAAGMSSYLFPQPPVYGAKTTLLITPMITEELGGKSAEGAPSAMAGFFLSASTLERLAVTNDIMVDIIEELRLRGNTAEMTVEGLSGMMEPKAELAEKGLPMLTMSVKGSKPEVLRDIADAWGKAFIEKNAELLSTSRAQSYDFISGRFNEVNYELKEKEDEKRKYMEENPLGTRSAELGVSKGTYNSHLTMLDAKKRAVNEAEARLKNLEAEIKDEPEFLELERAISNEGAWLLLGSNPNALNALPNLTVRDQIMNDHYFSLKRRLSDTRVSVETIKEEILYLEGGIEKLKMEIDEGEVRINEISIVIVRLDREISTLKSTYDFFSGKLEGARMAKEEQLQSIRVVEAPIVPQVPSKTSPMTNIVIAGVLGLFVGVFVAFFKNYMEGE